MNQYSKRLLVIFFLAVSSCDREITVTHGSMYPTLKKGEIVNLDENAYSDVEPIRGDLVLISPPKKLENSLPNSSLGEWITRVVAVPSDRLSIRSDGFTIVSSNDIDISFFPAIKNIEGIKYYWNPIYPLILSKDEYFVVGDNHNKSFDSRYWGPISRGQIVGKIYN